MKKRFFIKKILKATVRYLMRIDNKIKNYFRKQLGIFEYKKLSKPLKNYSFQIYNGNNTYGILNELKKYSSFKGVEKIAIEHGYYVGDFIYSDEILYTGLITFSKERSQIINIKSKKKIGYEIGPYIYYAKSYYNDKEILELKEKLGKTLLVFPSHSLECVDICQSNFLLEKIEELKNEYETIMICMYYADIQKGLNKLYENRGYKIVTAGHRYDIYFLSRLKSIIMLADYTISNIFGTHTIYSTFLNKPHTIFTEELKYQGNKEFIKKKVVKRALEELAINDDIYVNQKKLIDKYYTYYPNTINIIKIKEKLNYMMGFNEVKSPKEIYKILNGEKCEKI